MKVWFIILKKTRKRPKRLRHRPGSLAIEKRPGTCGRWPNTFPVFIIRPKIVYPKVWSFSISQLVLEQAFSPLQSKWLSKSIPFWSGVFHLMINSWGYLVNRCSKKFQLWPIHSFTPTLTRWITLQRASFDRFQLVLLPLVLLKFDLLTFFVWTPGS